MAVFVFILCRTEAARSQKGSGPFSGARQASKATTTVCKLFGAALVGGQIIITAGINHRQADQLPAPLRIPLPFAKRIPVLLAPPRDECLSDS